jgi:hypothetical protein
MKRVTKRRPSPAMAVAALALFLSLGGVSYGLATGSIDSREIRNSTIRGKDVRNGTLSAFDLGDSGRPVRKFGPVGINLGGQATLAAYGPFTVVAQCQANGPNTRLRVIIGSTENGSAFGAAQNTSGSFGPATPEAQRIMRQFAAGPGAVNHSDSTQDDFSALAPSGRAFTGTVHGVVNGQARNCRAYGGYTRVK